MSEALTHFLAALALEAVVIGAAAWAVWKALATPRMRKRSRELRPFERLVLGESFGVRPGTDGEGRR